MLDQEDSRKIYRNDYLWYPNDALVLSQNRTEVLVYNGGDADTPVETRFYGPASQPYIENLTTGEKVGITSNLEEGEYMDVYTAYGKKRVIIVDTDGGGAQCLPLSSGGQCVSYAAPWGKPVAVWVGGPGWHDWRRTGNSLL